MKLSSSTAAVTTDMTQQLLLLLVLLCLCHKAAAVTRMVVMEGQDVLLSCSIGSSTNIQLKLFDWKKDSQKEVFMYDRGSHYNKDRSDQDPQFKGRVFHFPEELKHGNASVLLRHSQVEDSGNYTCDFPFHQPSRRADVQLIVDPVLKPRPDVRGAAPEPSVISLEQTKDWSRLQCSVKGAFPKPLVQWQDRSGLVLPAEEAQVSERGGSYDIILQTTVTKTDHYRCVATQEEIKHQVYVETHVYVGEWPGTTVGAIVGAIFGAILTLCCKKKCCGKNNSNDPKRKTSSEERSAFELVSKAPPFMMFTLLEMIASQGRERSDS